MVHVPAGIMRKVEFHEGPYWVDCIPCYINDMPNVIKNSKLACLLTIRNVFKLPSATMTSVDFKMT